VAKQTFKVQQAIDGLNRLVDQLASLPPKTSRGLTEPFMQPDYQEVAEQLFHIAEKTRYVSRRTIEGRLNSVVLSVVQAIDSGAASDAARQIGKEGTRQLQAFLVGPPELWVVHMRVHNLSSKGLPFRIGNVQLSLADEPCLDEMQRPGHAVITTMKHTDHEKEMIKVKLREWIDCEFGGRTVAAVEVNALDQAAAKRGALDTLRETLDVLNYCRSVLPYPVRSWVYGDADPMPRRAASLLYRGSQEDPQGFSMPFENIGTLGKMDLEVLADDDAGRASVTQILAIAGRSSRSEVEEKVVTAARVAGAALTRHRRDHAFLLNVIALESLMLGEQRNEIPGPLQYRLGLRCAHLLADKVDERRRIVSRVRAIYDRRSAIVHQGKSDVTESEVDAAEWLVHRCLQRILARPEIVAGKSEALRQWFEDLILA